MAFFSEVPYNQKLQSEERYASFALALRRTAEILLKEDANR